VAAWEAPCRNPACREASRSASCLYPWHRWARDIRCGIHQPVSIDPLLPGSDGYATAPQSIPSSRRCSRCHRTSNNAALLNLLRRHSTDLTRRKSKFLSLIFQPRKHKNVFAIKEMLNIKKYISFRFAISTLIWSTYCLEMI